MSSGPPEAFLLLTISNTTAKTPSITQAGTLNLKCVTITPPSPPAGPASSTDKVVFLVLSVESFETPIDPGRVIHVSKAASGRRTYTFDGAGGVPNDLVLTISPPANLATTFEDNVEVFEGILFQYADLRHATTAEDDTLPTPTPLAHKVNLGVTPIAPTDLRGHLVLVNEANGEIVGGVEKKFDIHEDPVLYERGHESDTVIIEVPEGDALEMFARAVPPAERDWITNSATVIRYARSHLLPNPSVLITEAQPYDLLDHQPYSHNPYIHVNILHGQVPSLIHRQHRQCQCRYPPPKCPCPLRTCRSHRRPLRQRTRRPRQLQNCLPPPKHDRSRGGSQEGKRKGTEQTCLLC
jgi:spartin